MAYQHKLCEEAEEIINKIKRELMEAAYIYPAFNSAHEGIAIIQEEFEELWDEVKLKPSKRDPAKLEHEAVQLAAMAVRFVFDIVGGKKTNIQ